MAGPKGLGRGMGALLGDFEETTQEAGAYRLLPIYKVEPNPDQPRREFDEEELQALKTVDKKAEIKNKDWHNNPDTEKEEIKKLRNITYEEAEEEDAATEEGTENTEEEQR